MDETTTEPQPENPVSSPDGGVTTPEPVAPVLDPENPVEPLTPETEITDLRAQEPEDYTENSSLRVGIITALKEFPWWDYGLDNVFATIQEGDDEWTSPLADAILFQFGK